MFKFIRQFSKTIPVSSDVSETGYKIRLLPETANSDGEVYELTPPGKEPRLVYAVRNEDEIYDLSWAGYVPVVISDHIVVHERREVNKNRIEKPLSQEDHDALAAYFNDEVIRLYPPQREKANAPKVPERF